jgi:hypothetical protein
MKTTKHTTLKQASQTFFAQQQLPEASLDRFEQWLSADDQQTEQETAGTKPALPTDIAHQTSGYKPLALAASIVTATLIGSLWVMPAITPQEQPLFSATNSVDSQTQNKQKTIAAIADEVTKNHVKLKPLEVISPDFNTVRDYFTQLDFSPQTSRQFASTARVMAGGRYCSIQSESAAQLRYQSSTEQWSTLYQAQYSEAVFGRLPHVEQGQAPIETYSRGLKVNIWVERQLLMVSVEEAP